MASTANDEIDSTITNRELLSIGAINVAWSFLDTVTTACLFSMLEMEPFEFLILVGRVEPEAKMAKLGQILKHRKDPRSKTILALKKRLSKEKGLRNALTHGQYEGKTADDMLLWSTAAEILETENGPAKTLIVTSDREMEEHIRVLNEAISYLRAHFEVEKMRVMLRLPSQINGALHSSRGHGDSPSLRPRRAQRTG